MPATKQDKDSATSETCPVCFDKPAYLYTIDRFTPAFDILRCPGCGLEMQASIPEDASDFYTEEYYTGRAEYNYHDERLSAHYDRYVWRARLKKIKQFVSPPASFLDVGCAFGGLVETAANMGYQAQGLDVSDYAVKNGRSRGLNIKRGILEPGVLPPASIDVATMIEVIEHIEQPLKAMQCLREIIRPGGLLVIQTANFLGQQARQAGADYHYYLPGHLYYYSTYTLSRMLERYGFGDIKIFRPVDFGLFPKLLKSRGQFKKIIDYKRWLRIAQFHLAGRLAWRHYAQTSSMVVYARRL